MSQDHNALRAQDHPDSTASDGEPRQDASRPARSGASLRGGSARRGRSGQAGAEFALVIPLFLLLVAGIIDFGLGLNASITVTNAAREAARLGVVKPYSDQITARAQAEAVGLNPANLTVTASCVRSGGTCTLGTGTTAGTAASGDSVSVTVSYSYRMIWPLAFGNVINLTQTSDFRIE